MSFGTQRSTDAIDPPATADSPPDSTSPPSPRPPASPFDPPATAKRDRPDPPELPGALFATLRGDTFYTLLCLDDGHYAIAADVHLLPTRWHADDFDDCYRVFKQLIAQAPPNAPPPTTAKRANGSPPHPL